MPKQPPHPAGEPPDHPEDEHSTGEPPAEPELDLAEMQTLFLTLPQNLRDSRATGLTHHRWWADHLREQRVGIQREIAALQGELQTMRSEREQGGYQMHRAALWQKWRELDVSRRAQLAAYRSIQSETDQR